MIWKAVTAAIQIKTMTPAVLRLLIKCSFTCLLYVLIRSHQIPYTGFFTISIQDPDGSLNDFLQISARSSHRSFSSAFKDLLLISKHKHAILIKQILN